MIPALKPIALAHIVVGILMATLGAGIAWIFHEVGTSGLHQGRPPTSFLTTAAVLIPWIGTGLFLVAVGAGLGRARRWARLASLILPPAIVLGPLPFTLLPSPDAPGALWRFIGEFAMMSQLFWLPISAWWVFLYGCFRRPEIKREFQPIESLDS